MVVDTFIAGLLGDVREREIFLPHVDGVPAEPLYFAQPLVHARRFWPKHQIGALDDGLTADERIDLGREGILILQLPIGEDPPPPHTDADAPAEKDLPTIQVSTAEKAVNTAALGALSGAGYTDLYQRSGSLVRVIHAADRPGKDKLRIGEDLPMIRSLSNATLRERLADCARWVKFDGRSGDVKPAHPPQWSVLAVADRGSYPGIPVLRGVASYPMIRPDGTVSSSTGYDPGTGYYLGSLPEGLKVDGQVSQVQAYEAAGRLLDLVCDFPFRGPIDQAAWLAYLLTPLARAVVDGPTPMFLIDANIRGSGKTLLADVAGYALMGHQLPAHTYPGRDEELEKILVGVARYGLPVVCFDNVVGRLGGGVLDKWITSTSPTGRVLGASEVIQFDWTTILVSTANNAQIAGDTDRRTIYSTMETAEERPELRTGFKIDDLPGHIKANRASILSDALAILRGHWQAGIPSMGGRPKGTFESWCRRVRDAVMWAGCADAERGADDPARPIDEDADELAALLSGLYEAFAGDSVSVSEMLDAAFPVGHEAYSQYSALRDALAMMATKGDRPSRQLIGKRLGRYRNRWLGDLAITSERDTHTKAHRWRVSERKSAGNADSKRSVPGS